ncbi:RluA family pseudouridine synthase [Desulfopila inferna]|uniref:RluA family pseudouridine synthase n=1 Tax=Desulfopila inferna TaxID=468528 RepID=UPI0019657167|nr:RluA family pseudouridine synthase [Desulfopila inferna]MBM9606136.1 RluA family pseudouridine synthase [Desulfopila inferna]
MNLLFHDSEIIVIDKPGGLLAVPGRGPDRQDCVVSRLHRRFADLIPQPAVHRLDMYTSGVMILARTRESHRSLSMQFEQRKPAKIYIALVEGFPVEQQGRIELKFRLDIDNRPYQVHDPVNGKNGITLWRKLAKENGCTRIMFQPLTGRTHQLRLHAAHPLGLGAPIVGDSLYGNGREGDKMMLHAASLSISHPLSGEVLTFTSNVPF